MFDSHDNNYHSNLANLCNQIHINFWLRKQNSLN